LNYLALIKIRELFIPEVVILAIGITVKVGYKSEKQKNTISKACPVYCRVKLQNKELSVVCEK
jgi:hypothetical protein